MLVCSFVSDNNAHTHTHMHTHTLPVHYYNTLLYCLDDFTLGLSVKRGQHISASRCLLVCSVVSEDHNGLNGECQTSTNSPRAIPHNGVIDDIAVVMMTRSQ